MCAPKGLFRALGAKIVLHKQSVCTQILAKEQIDYTSVIETKFVGLFLSYGVCLQPASSIMLTMTKQMAYPPLLMYLYANMLCFILVSADSFVAVQSEALDVKLSNRNAHMASLVGLVSVEMAPDLYGAF